MSIPVEIRLALADLAIAFGNAVDDIGNSAGVAALFTENAVYDLSPLGMPMVEGRAGVKAFFDAAFADMAQNFHLIGNVVVAHWDGADGARFAAYCHAYSRAKAGTTLEVKVRYTIDAARADGVWQIARMALEMMQPPIMHPAG